MDLTNQLAIVTGCGTDPSGVGNGMAIAIGLARAGAHVIGIEKNKEAADHTNSYAKKEGLEIDFIIKDVNDVELIKDLDQKYNNKIDILVNNVGQSEPGNIETMKIETWKDQIELNLNTAFMMCKQVIPLMKSNGSGAIVNISSVAGLRYAGKSQIGYAAAKAALIQFTRVSAIDYAKSGIRINCVVPGLIYTPLVKRLAKKYSDNKFEDFVAHRHAQVPMGFMGDAWDISHAVNFLVDKKSRYITGQSLIVDGGLTISTP